MPPNNGPRTKLGYDTRAFFFSSSTISWLFNTLTVFLVYVKSLISMLNFLLILSMALTNISFSTTFIETIFSWSTIFCWRPSMISIFLVSNKFFSLIALINFFLSSILAFHLSPTHHMWSSNDRWKQQVYRGRPQWNPSYCWPQHNPSALNQPL